MDERERYARVGAAFLRKVAQRLQSLDVEQLSAADTARWTEVALKLDQAGNLRRLPEDRRERYLESITRDRDESVDLEEYDEEGSSDDQ